MRPPGVSSTNFFVTCGSRHANARATIYNHIHIHTHTHLSLLHGFKTRQRTCHYTESQAQGRWEGQGCAGWGRLGVEWSMRSTRSMRF